MGYSTVQTTYIHDQYLQMINLEEILQIKRVSRILNAGPSSLLIAVTQQVRNLPSDGKWWKLKLLVVGTIRNAAVTFPTRLCHSDLL